MIALELQTTINALAVRKKGILAADESVPTCTKRFEKLGIEATEEMRRRYRELLLTAPQMEDYISGVILFEETLKQSTSEGVPFASYLANKNIVPGIKVDQGVRPLPFSPEECYTQGLDDLSERLHTYKKLGARFAKWRAVLSISDIFPSMACIAANAEGLAQYAAICQANGVVPIVEPELLMDGAHDIERCYAATEQVWHAVFDRLYHHRVVLEHMILKPSMVISGAACLRQADVNTVAEQTLRLLRRQVPAAVPSINFLSGGQSNELATLHLKAMNALPVSKPWRLSFSYGRALQSSALTTWAGKETNWDAAQQAFIERARANSEASGA